ncbi:MAG: type II secretion system protein GspN [Desulfobacterales bacterium]|nr:MAG: type II secretion system protein GspN [Desulfobacterales bacterium]
MIRRILLYGFVFTGCFLVFTWIQFPSGEFRSWLAYRISQRLPGTEVTVGRLSPAFPAGIRISPLTVTRDGSRMVMDRAALHPVLTKLTGSVPEVKLDIELYGGRITGDLSVDRRKDSQARINAKWTGIRLDNIEPLQAALKDTLVTSLSGAADGTLSFAGRTGAVEFKAADVQAKLNSPLIPLEQTIFSTVAGKFTLDSRQMTIEALNADGPEAVVELTGTAALKKPMGKTRLDLSGKITARPELIRKLGGLGAAIFTGKAGRSGLSFRVRGEVDKPRFSLK